MTVKIQYNLGKGSIKCQKWPIAPLTFIKQFYFSSILFFFYSCKKKKHPVKNKVKRQNIEVLKNHKWHLILTDGHSILPLLMSSMTSWGGRPSMVQPTDWAVPRISLMVPEKQRERLLCAIVLNQQLIHA